MVQQMGALPITQSHEVTEILGLELHTAEVHVTVCPAQQLSTPRPTKNKEQGNSLGVPFSLNQE